MIRALLFDNDGVLAHTEELFFRINTECFEEMGIPYTRDDFKNHTFITSLGTTGFMKSVGCSSEQIDQFKNKRSHLWQRAVVQTNTVDLEAEKVFLLLKDTYKLGVVTNTIYEDFIKTHHDSSIPDVADFIVTREDYDEGKPAPDSYRKGLEVAGCSPNEALVIEDSPRGLAAAKTVGIKTIAIPNPVIKHLDTSDANYRITRLSELPDFLGTIT